MSDEEAWLDLSSALAAASASDVRSDAAELRTVEAARSRLADRRGPAVLRLIGGATLAGSLVASDVDGWLALVVDERDVRLVRASAVVLIGASTAGLRAEGAGLGRSVGSWLRDRFEENDDVRATLVDGDVVAGRVVRVGADHAELRADDRTWAVPWSAVVMWAVRP
ncbi:MAG: hypothetical protein U0R65_14405 [Candidatus Nanopelagicales bacterium]